MKKIKLKEGDIFLLPLTDGGFSIGLLARVIPWGALGYFFKIKYSEAPQHIDLSLLNKDNVLYIGKFGTRNLYEGKWKLIDKLPNWDRDYWNIPKFGCNANPVYYLITLNDKLEEIERIPCTKEAIEGLLEAGTYGYEAMSIKMSKLLQDAGIEAM